MTHKSLIPILQATCYVLLFAVGLQAMGRWERESVVGSNAKCSLEHPQAIMMFVMVTFGTPAQDLIPGGN